MDLRILKENIKKIALDSGAGLVGVGTRERLKDAPASADMDYCLPGAETCIIWAYPNPIEALENYFSKKERIGIKKQQHFAYSTAWATAVKICGLLEEKGHRSFPVIPNGKYRQEGSYKNFLQVDNAFPDFSLRYGAVAAGLGHIGWSGNLVTKEYGGSLYLAGVLTTAPLEPDPMAEKNNCNKCGICYKSCTTGYFPMDEEEESVLIGGSREVYSKRGTYSKCGITCAGWTGMSEDGKWSIWSPGHICLKDYSNKEWKETDIRQKIIEKIFNDRDTPENIKKFNEKILISFAKVAEFENVGLRPLEDTNPRCGNCSFICVADPKKRKELYNMLVKGGKVFIDEKGREYVVRIKDDGTEVTYYPPAAEE